MKVIGLTGGIGAGKGEVASLLRSLGASVIEADIEGHQTYRRGAEGWRRIVEVFGRGLLDENEEIDRVRLGRLVFADDGALASLNEAVHPLIREALRERIAEHREAVGATAVPDAIVVEAAVLLEAGWDDLVDEVWVVWAPPELAVERVQRQRGLSEAEVRQRLDAQASNEWKIAKADVAIENTGDLQDLRRQVERLWRERINQKG